MTEFEKLNPKSIEDLNKLRGRIAGVMMPKDPSQIERIESQIELDRDDVDLKMEYTECLKRCVCMELVQIKEFKQL